MTGQTLSTAIKTRRDGSIDTAYYIAKGRHARSQAAHDMMRAGLPATSNARGTGKRGWIVALALLSVVMVALPHLA